MTRSRLHTVTIAAIGFFALSAVVYAQGTDADYQRAARMGEMTRNKVFKTRVVPTWTADNNRLWYRNDLTDGRREFIAVDTVAGKREAAFDHAKLAAALGEKLGRAVDAAKLPLDRFEFVDENRAVRFAAESKFWKFDLAKGEIAEIEKFEFATQPQTPTNVPRRGQRRRTSSSPRRDMSPDLRWTVSIKEHNLVLRRVLSGEEFPLTTDGRADHTYERGVFWAPDSSRFVAVCTRPAQEHKVYLVESSPRGQLQPRLHTLDYLKPGDRIAMSKPCLFDVAARKQIPISDERFRDPWSVGEFRWTADSRRFTFLYNQRGHQTLRIVAIDGQTGEAGTIVNEESKTFVDYAHKQFSHYLDATGEIVWMSERDGWNHLYLYDSRTGQVKNQITRGPWIVRGVDRVDDETRQIWFRASGIYPEQDPYYIHVCRINFDGGGFMPLTQGNGTHEIVDSPDRRFIIDTYSRVDQPPITELRRVEDGKLVCELERADWSQLLATGWKTPERFVAKGRDGQTDIHGVIWRPTNFDAAKKYPVIEQIYAGPQGSFVPKSFSPLHRTQPLAELGFIVVQMDGMGTSNRSKAFHDVCCKNLGDSGFPDRILWLKKAAEQYPCMDLSRVGIYGGSAGGQSTVRGLLAHGDFYKVGVADCGCHDNRMDKIWWNELWMGYPIGDHYAEQSNVTQAHRLSGKLLLIVGELDRNVDPASTMQVVNALIRADKDFDLLVVPGGGHGSGGGPYGTRRTRDFFVRHLLGVEPRRGA